MHPRTALLVGATLAVTLGGLGCDHKSEMVAAGLLCAAYTGDRTVLDQLAAEEREDRIDNLIAKFSLAQDRKIELWGTSSLNGALSFEGTYTQSDSGVSATLQGTGYGAGNAARTMALETTGPGANGSLSGTMTYTWEGATYTGPVALTPAPAD